MACGLTTPLSVDPAPTTALECCPPADIYPADQYTPTAFKPGMDVPPVTPPDPVFYHEQFNFRGISPFVRRPGGSYLASSPPIIRRTTGIDHTTPGTEPPTTPPGTTGSTGHPGGTIPPDIVEH